jgi:hypothetical protein
VCRRGFSYTDPSQVGSSEHVLALCGLQTTPRCGIGVEFVSVFLCFSSGYMPGFDFVGIGMNVILLLPSRLFDVCCVGIDPICLTSSIGPRSPHIIS